MTTKHTPGPWKYNEDGDGYLIQGGHHSQYGHLYVANCQVSSAHRDAKETLANIRLIAAAPELLEACRFAVKYHQMKEEKGLEGFPTQLLRSLESSIQKAGAA